ncbi:MAG: hypothetical protein AB7F86_06850 [Bdellovibrionales bacterium]
MSRIFGGVILAQVLVASMSHADDLKLPSSVSVSGGAGSQSYQDWGLFGAFTLPHNWQADLSLRRTATEGSDSSDGTQFIREAEIGLGTNPLKPWSGRIGVNRWEAPSSVIATGSSASVVWTPWRWAFELVGGGQKLELRNLPSSVVSSQKTTVQDSFVSLRVSTPTYHRFRFTARATSHHYDKDISEISNYTSTILDQFPPSVLTSLTGLNKNDVMLNALFMRSRWDLGAEVGRSISAIDGSRTRRLGAQAVFYLNDQWSFGLATAFYKPESDEASNATTHATTGTATFSF